MPRTARLDTYALAQLTRQQNQLATHAQLFELGMARATLSHRIGPDGRWQRLLPGIVLLHSGPPTRSQRLAGALLYAGPGAVLTGAESLRLRGFRHVEIDIGLVHILLPQQRQRASAGFVVIERTHRLPSATVVERVPVAPLARSVLDAARRSRSLDHIRAVIAEAVQQRRCSTEGLLEELRSAQRRGTARPRRVLNEVTQGIRSVEEAYFRQLLIDRGIDQPMWNVDLRLPDGRFIASPDAWWDDHGVAVEIDSREWHLTPDGWERTLRRHAAMATLGVTVLHVTPQRQRRDADAVIQELRTALHFAAARPRPDVVAVRGTQYAA